MWIKDDGNKSEITQRLVHNILRYFHCHVSDDGILVWNNGKLLFRMYWVEKWQDAFC
jgi:hypothetical protein